MLWANNNLLELVSSLSMYFGGDAWEGIARQLRVGTADNCNGCTQCQRDENREEDEEDKVEVVSVVVVVAETK